MTCQHLHAIWDGNGRRCYTCGVPWEVFRHEWEGHDPSGIVMSDGFVVVTASGLAKGNDNCRDGKPRIFPTRMDAELDAALFSGERVMTYQDYCQKRENVALRDGLIDTLMRFLGYRSRAKP